MGEVIDRSGVTGRLTDRMGKLEQHTIIETQWEKERKQQTQFRFSSLPLSLSFSTCLSIFISIAQFCFNNAEANLNVNTNIIHKEIIPLTQTSPKKAESEVGQWSAVVPCNITEMEAAGIN